MIYILGCVSGSRRHPPNPVLLLRTTYGLTDAMWHCERRVTSGRALSLLKTKFPPLLLIRSLLALADSGTMAPSSPSTTVSIDATKFCKNPTECDSKRIAGIGLYQAKLATPIPIGKRRYNVRLYNIIFVLGYVVLGFQVLSTIGEPYRRFLEKADREGFQGLYFLRSC